MDAKGEEASQLGKHFERRENERRMNVVYLQIFSKNLGSRQRLLLFASSTHNSEKKIQNVANNLQRIRNITQLKLGLSSKWN